MLPSVGGGRMLGFWAVGAASLQGEALARSGILRPRVCFPANENRWCCRGEEQRFAPHSCFAEGMHCNFDKQSEGLIKGLA